MTAEQLDDAGPGYPAPASLDHLVLAAPDLGAAARRFAELTGVDPVPGGRHEGLGTANVLVGLGGTAYLEIIGPDRAQPTPDRPRPFGIDALDRPRLTAWAIHPDDLDARVAAARAAGHDPGDPRPLSRAAPDGELLRWRLTWPDMADGIALVPFLIDWGDTPAPPERGLPVVELVDLAASHPRPSAVRASLAALGVDLPVHLGTRASLRARLRGRHGPVVLD
ncbi:MAG TPA: VOC family protein [Pseudonocardia sp.]